MVPIEGGGWQVVDPRRNSQIFSSRKAAVESAKAVASANQPSQVVLFDPLGRIVPIAQYQLPRYSGSRHDAGDSPSPFEAAVKAMVIGELVDAGVPVLSELVTSVNKELQTAAMKSKSSKRRPRRAA